MLFWRQGHQISPALLLLLLQVPIDRFQIIIEFRGVFLAIHSGSGAGRGDGMD
jgi:hypothetical protein